MGEGDAARLLELARAELEASRRNLSQAVWAAHLAARRMRLALVCLVLAIGVMAGHIVVYGW